MDLNDICQHNTKQDCWIVINDSVYNVTDYLDQHPGGSTIIINCSGRDATKEFNQVGHSRNANAILAKYAIGQVDKSDEIPSLFQNIWTWFFPMKQPQIDTRAHLMQRSQLTHDTIRLMFVVPRMDLKCGQHLVCTKGDLQRKYTPVHSTHNSFDIIVKIYNTGGMSAYLNTLRIGDRLTVSEPLGSKIYLGNGTFSNLNIQAHRMLMICAGTGITPMYPILRRISDARENVYVDVLYVNKTAGDILLQDELEHMCLKSSNITVRYAFTRTHGPPPLLQGRPTKEMIASLGGCDLALICGPSGFNDSVNSICNELSYPTIVF